MDGTAPNERETLLERAAELIKQDKTDNTDENGREDP